MALDADRPGRFSDGRSAAARRVQVRVMSTGLEIRDEDGLLIAHWRTEDLLADGDWPEKRGVRLRCAAEPDARLAVEDAYVIAQSLPQPAAPPKTHRRALILGCLLGAGLLIGLALGLGPASKALAYLIPAGTEHRWGEAMAEGFERHLRTCKGQPGLDTLEHLATRLAAPLPADRREVRIHVLASPDVNALALPGGEIVVFSGLLRAAGGPDELAGVLAHELTHIGRRHVGAAMIRAMGVGALVTLVTGDASGLVAGGLGAAVAGAYSREDEAEADRGAVDLLEAAGIGADGLALFFRRLQTMEAGQGVWLAWLGTHPDSASRAEAVEALRRPAAHAPALSDAEWQAVRRICSKAPS